MRKITRKALTVTAVAATATALTAMPASAVVTSVSVSPGGTVAGTSAGPVAGINKNTGATLVCQQLTASGQLTAGSGQSPIDIAELTAMNFINCVVNGSVAATATAKNLSWSLDITDVTAGGKTPGKVKGVHVEVDAPGLGCKIEVAGPGAGGSGGFIEGEHTNPASAGAPSTLSLPTTAANNLEVIATTGTCAGLANLGDNVTFAGTINLNPGQTIVAT